MLVVLARLQVDEAHEANEAKRGEEWWYIRVRAVYIACASRLRTRAPRIIHIYKPIRTYNKVSPGDSGAKALDNLVRARATLLVGEPERRSGAIFIPGVEIDLQDLIQDLQLKTML